MPEFLRPGVFVIETSFRGKPIEGVATSTAGFVGRAATGPAGKPTLVTSFTQFVREFGQPYPNPQNMGEYLGHSVASFFDNGGLRAYIVRVLGAGAQAATNAYYRGNVARLPATATVRGPTSALPLASMRGVHVGATVDIYTRSSSKLPFPASPKYSSTVASYDAGSRVVTLTAPLPASAVLDPANTFVAFDAAKPALTATLNFAARNEGLAGNTLGVSFRQADLPPVRLQTRKLVPAQPVIGTNVSGPLAAGNAISGLSKPQMRALRNGDTIKLDNGTGGVETKVIDPAVGIADATVTYNVDAGAEPAAYTGPVNLINRTGAGADLTAGGVTLFQTTGAAFAAGSVTLPHAAAAMLQDGDKLTAGGLTFTIKANGITYAASATLSTPVVNKQSSTTLTLLNTAAPSLASSTFGRLVVADTSALNTPVRRNTTTNAPAPEPIAVTDGVNTEAATVVLVDASTNSVFYANTVAFTWSSLQINGWTGIESLQVAHSGDTSLALVSTASFYGGASVKFDDGDNPQYFVVASVDGAARTVTLSSPLVIAGSGYLDVASLPDERSAFLQVLEFDALVYQADTVAETFSGLVWNNDPLADSYRKYYANAINDPRSGSSLVSVVAPPPADDDGSLSKAPSTTDGFVQNLLNGGDGVAPTNVDIIGHDNGPGSRTGIQALIEREDIAIVAAPGITDVAVQEELITHCERLKYRFAVLDGIAHTSDVSKVQAHRNNYDTKYAAYYEPWLQALNRTTGSAMLVPPSGHLVGIYARSDNERGVHKAPANEVVRNVFDLEFQFGNGEQEVLNPVGVNLVRQFTGRGIRVWGARTLSSDPEWKYINVRRLFIFLEHSIDNGTQWVVFEPNNEELWARVKSTIEAFLLGVWKTGALMGTKPEEAYFVKCDRTTMTQDDIDNGRLVVLIGVAPTYPAEFVIFQIGQFTATKPGG